MKRAAGTLLGLAAAVSLMLLGTGCEKLRARDALNKGVMMYKGAKYAEAVEFFKTSVELDPTFPTARLYLATAYMSQYIPGADLEQNPSDKIAVASMASLYYSQAQGQQSLDAKLAKLDEARQWYEKLAQVDPQNKEAFYSLGVIVWAKWYPALMAARAKLNMKPEDPGPLKDKELKQELKDKWSTTIDDGLKSLEKALAIDNQYDDAMAYMNLLIRERADLAETPEQYKKDIEAADAWVQKALEAKKIKAAKQPSAGIVSEEAK
jgi:tetratricopeptide (TPR) repeat protein